MIESYNSFTELIPNQIEADGSEEDEMDEYSDLIPNKTAAHGVVKVYKLRWFILFLYSFTAFANTLVWLSLFTVSDATSSFYNVDVPVLLWSSNAFTLMQVIIAIPASFLPSKLGLRTTMILASSINAIGACVMVAGAHRSGFPFFVTGQTIIAAAASILPQLAPEVSAVWFPQNEHALSTGIGVMLGNAGAAIGFLQPALLLKDVDIEKDIETVGVKLKQLIYSQAALCLALLISVCLFFKNNPKRPPTYAQSLRKGTADFSFIDFKTNLKTLLKNRNYHLCANSFALNNVILIIVPLILNSIITWKFPKTEATIGWMGFAGILFGLTGSVIFGFIQDKTQAYKTIALSLSITSLVLWVAFTESLTRWHNLTILFVLFVGNLFFFIPYGPVLVDMICEMTYPIPESSSFVIPITMSRLYSIPLIFLLGWLVDQKKFYISCYVVAGTIFVMMLLMIFARIDRRRHIAEGDLPAVNIM